MSMSVEQFQAIKERAKFHVSVAEDRNALIEHVEENHVQIARLEASVSGHAAANAEIARATGCSHAADIVAYVNGLLPEIAMLKCTADGHKRRADEFKAALERTVSTVESILKDTHCQSLPELRDCLLTMYGQTRQYDDAIRDVKAKHRTYTGKPTLVGEITTEGVTTKADAMKRGLWPHQKGPVTWGFASSLLAEDLKNMGKTRNEEPPISSFEAPAILSIGDYLRAQGLRIGVLRMSHGPDGTTAEVSLSDGSMISTTNKAVIDALIEYSHTA